MHNNNPSNPCTCAAASAAPMPKAVIIRGCDVAELLSALRNIKADYAIRAICPPRTPQDEYINASLTTDNYMCLDYLEWELNQTLIEAK